MGKVVYDMGSFQNMGYFVDLEYKKTWKFWLWSWFGWWDAFLKYELFCWIGIEGGLPPLCI